MPTPLEQPAEWWRFAISAVRADVHARSSRARWNLSAPFLAKRRRQRLAYISLFKAKLALDRSGDALAASATNAIAGSGDTLELLRALEDELSYDDIIFYRSLARADSRFEQAVAVTNSSLRRSASTRPVATPAHAKLLAPATPLVASSSSSSSLHGASSVATPAPPSSTPAHASSSHVTANSTASTAKQQHSHATAATTTTTTTMTTPAAATMSKTSATSHDDVVDGGSGWLNWAWSWVRPLQTATSSSQSPEPLTARDAASNAALDDALRRQIYAAIEYDPSDAATALAALAATNVAQSASARWSTTKLRIVVGDGSIGVRRRPPTALRTRAAVSAQSERGLDDDLRLRRRRRRARAADANAAASAGSDGIIRLLFVGLAVQYDQRPASYKLQIVLRALELYDALSPRTRFARLVAPVWYLQCAMLHVFN